MLEAKIVAGGQRASSSCQSAFLSASVFGDRFDHELAVGERASSVVKVSRVSAVSRAAASSFSFSTSRSSEVRDPGLARAAGAGSLTSRTTDGEAGRGGRLRDAAAHEAAPSTPIRSKGTLPAPDHGLEGLPDLVGQEVDQAGRSRREPCSGAGALLQVVEGPLQAELDPRGHRSVAPERHVAEAEADGTGIKARSAKAPIATSSPPVPPPRRRPARRCRHGLGARAFLAVAVRATWQYPVSSASTVADTVSALASMIGRAPGAERRRWSGGTPPGSRRSAPR